MKLGPEWVERVVGCFSFKFSAGQGPEFDADRVALESVLVSLFEKGRASGMEEDVFTRQDFIDRAAIAWFSFQHGLLASSYVMEKAWSHAEALWEGREKRRRAFVQGRVIRGDEGSDG